MKAIYPFCCPSFSRILNFINSCVNLFHDICNLYHMESYNFSFEPKYCKYQGKCEELNAVASGTSRNYSSELESIAKKYEWLNFVKTNSYICTKSTCSMTTGSDLLYRDNNHLNVKGSKFIGKLILGDFPNLLVSK